MAEAPKPAPGLRAVTALSTESWDIPRGGRELRPGAPRWQARARAFVPGLEVAAAALDAAGHVALVAAGCQALLFDVEGRRPVHQLLFSNRVTQVALSRDGGRAACFVRGFGGYLWAPGAAPERFSGDLPDVPELAAFTADGQALLVTGEDAAVACFEADTGALRWSWRGAASGAPRQFLNLPGWDAAGCLVEAGGRRHEVWSLGLSTGEARRLEYHEGAAAGVLVPDPRSPATPELTPVRFLPGDAFRSALDAEGRWLALFTPDKFDARVVRYDLTQGRRGLGGLPTPVELAAPFERDGPAPVRARALAVSTSGQVLWADSQGVALLSEDPPAARQSVSPVRALLIERDGAVWAADRTGAWRRSDDDAAGPEWERRSDDPAVRSLVQDGTEAGRVWKFSGDECRTLAEPSTRAGMGQVVALSRHPPRVLTRLKSFAYIEDLQGDGSRTSRRQYLPGPGASTVYVGCRDELLMAGPRGLRRYRIEAEFFPEVVDPTPARALLAVDPPGTLAVTATRAGLRVTPLADPGAVEVYPVPQAAAAVFLSRGRLVVGTFDGHLHLLDLRRRREARPWRASGAAIVCLATDPAGERLVSGASDGAVVEWELARWGAR